MFTSCVGIIRIAMIKVKNGRFSLHSYATSAYAVSVEKYTVHPVTPREIRIELKKPLIGLKLLPVRILKLFIRYFDGIREIACAWISVVLLVEFTTMMINGIKLITASTIHKT